VILSVHIRDGRKGEDVEVKGDQVRKIKEKAQGMTDGQYGVRNSMLKD
jgi:hypothetical protein